MILLQKISTKLGISLTQITNLMVSAITMTNDSTAIFGLLPLVVGVTGHTDPVEGTIDSVLKTVRQVLNQIATAHPSTQVHVLSALAEGADQLVAQEALNLDPPLPLIAVLPMPIDKYAATMTSESARRNLHHLWESATLRIELPEVKDEPAEFQYEQVGVVISRFSHVLLALWNGRDEWNPRAEDAVRRKQQGGTAHTVYLRAAGEEESQVFGKSRIFPSARTRLGLVDSGWTLRIATPRRKQPEFWGDEEAGSLWLCKGTDKGTEIDPKDNVVAALSAQLKDDTPVLRLLDCANNLLRTLAEHQGLKIGRSKGHILSPTDLDSLGEGREPVERILNTYAQADLVAQTNRHKTNRVILCLAASLPAAVLAFEVYAHVFPTPFVLSLYLTVIALAFAGYFFGIKRGKWQTNFQDYRALAEALRVQLYWALGGVPCGVADYYLRKHRNEMSWIHHALRGPALWAIGPALWAIQSGGVGQKRRKLVVDRWVLGQFTYFAGDKTRPDKALLNKRRHELFEKWASMAYFFGLALAMLMLLAQLVLEHLDHTIIEAGIILMGFAPAVAGALSIFAEKSAFKDHAHSYSRMGHVFNKAQKLLAPDNEVDSEMFASVIRELGAEALAESGDWLMAHRDRPVEPIKGG